MNMFVKNIIAHHQDTIQEKFQQKVSSKFITDVVKEATATANTSITAIVSITEENKNHMNFIIADK